MNSGARSDLTHLRPWKAVPMDPKRPSEDAWKVVAPSKTGRPDDWCEVVSYLSEDDAKMIAAGSFLGDIPF